MFKKEITYKNLLDGATVTETLYFNLTAPEVIDMGLGVDDDMESFVKDIVARDDRRQMFSMIKLIMAHAYGRRTPDGKGFAKKKEWLDELFCGFAYEELFIWIFTSEKNAATFFNQLMPPKETLDRFISSMNTNDDTSSAPKSPKDMTREELEAAFALKMAGRAIVPPDDAS